MSSRVEIGTPTRPTSPQARSIIRVEPELRRQIEGDAQAGRAPLEQQAVAGVALLRPRRIRRTGASSSAGRGTSSDRCRGCRGSNPDPVPDASSIALPIDRSDLDPGIGHDVIVTAAMRVSPRGIHDQEDAARAPRPTPCSPPPGCLASPVPGRALSAPHRTIQDGQKRCANRAPQCEARASIKRMPAASKPVRAAMRSGTAYAT